MLETSYFKMLLDYKSKGFQKHFTNALIQGLIQTKEANDEIESSLTEFKEEGKQLFYVASFIQRELQNELQRPQEYIMRIHHSNEGKGHNDSDYYLSDFIAEIMYSNIDYYEAAKQLTRLYRQNKGIQNKKVA
jgi:hypothetical protein